MGSWHLVGLAQTWWDSALSELPIKSPRSAFNLERHDNNFAVSESDMLKMAEETYVLLVICVHATNCSSMCSRYSDENLAGRFNLGSLSHVNWIIYTVVRKLNWFRAFINIQKISNSHFVYLLHRQGTPSFVYLGTRNDWNAHDRRKRKPPQYNCQWPRLLNCISIWVVTPDQRMLVIKTNDEWNSFYV